MSTAARSVRLIVPLETFPVFPSFLFDCGWSVPGGTEMPLEFAHLLQRVLLGFP
jgi:hypothetical protein